MHTRVIAVAARRLAFPAVIAAIAALAVATFASPASADPTAPGARDTTARSAPAVRDSSRSSGSATVRYASRSNETVRASSGGTRINTAALFKYQRQFAHR